MPEKCLNTSWSQKLFWEIQILIRKWKRVRDIYRQLKSYEKGEDGTLAVYTLYFLSSLYIPLILLIIIH